MKVIRSPERRGILFNSQEGGFLSFLRPLTTAGLPLMRNILTLLGKIVLVSLGLTAAASAIDAAIQKEIDGSGHSLDLAKRRTRVFSNENLNDIMKIVNS